MSPLDYSSPHPDPSEVSPWPTAIKYGGIGGLIFILYSLVGNITGIGRPSAGLVTVMLFGLAYFAIYFGILTFAIKKHRDEELGGFIDIKRSVIVGTVVAVIAGIIASLFGYLYMTVIEPDMANTMIKEMTEMFEEMGLTEEQYEQQIVDMEDRLNPTTALTQGILGAPIIGAIASLIIGAIVKKSPKDVA